MNNEIFVYPVIHVLNQDLALQQADLAFDAGADGVFLINHYGDDEILPIIGQKIKQKYPDKKVGLNYLANGPIEAYSAARTNGMDMAWGDNCGVNSKGYSALGEHLMGMAKDNEVKLFASVAFKYQAHEEYPDKAASNALNAGFIPTTSGGATGSAPSVEKIQLMSQAVGGDLAVASGMTAENIQRFAPFLRYALVATGVSVDEHHFDYELLYRFIVLAKQAKAASVVEGA